MKKRLLAVLTAAVLGVSALVLPLSGCNSNTAYEGDYGLNIITLKKGYGTEWLEALADEMEEMYPGITIVIKTEVVDTNITNKLDAGEGYCEWDLFFGGTDFRSYIKTTMDGSNVVLADLSDIYANPASEEETIIVEDKLDDSLLSSFQNENAAGETKYYTMPWTQGINGLLVNNEVVAGALGADWRETYPCRTTDEWMDLLDALAGEGEYSFIYAAGQQYYQTLYNVWWTQYEGLEGIENYYSGMAYNVTTDRMELSPLIFEQDGRYAAMDVMESIMKDPYVYPKSTGIEWDAMQTYFMAGEAAMLPNGDWTNIEMGKSFPDNDVQFMRVPIVSALGEKLGITEDELRAAVSYADALLDGETATKPVLAPKEVNGVTLTADEVLQEVYDARCVVDTYANLHTVCAAAWSPRLEYAKAFLKLMASDKGQEIYAEAMDGNTSLPYGYDISTCDWFASTSEFAKTRYELAKNATYYYRHAELPLGNDLLAWRAVYSAPIEHCLYSLGWSGDDVVQEDIDYYSTGTRWTDLLKKAGLR